VIEPLQSTLNGPLVAAGVFGRLCPVLRPLRKPSPEGFPGGWFVALRISVSEVTTSRHKDGFGH